MDGKWWLGYFLIFLFAAPAFSQDTIYLDKKGRWLDSKENAFRYCTRVELAEDNIEVKVYNLGDTLLYLHHFSNFIDNPKKCILNGVSSIYYADGQLSDTYMNVKGKKEGEYRRFYRDGKLKYLCNFENNRREGQLEMYYPNGSLWRTEEFRKGVSQGGHVYDAAGNEIEFYPSERILGFPGGVDALAFFMKEHVHYPLEASEQKVEGRVLVQLTFDRRGRIVEYHVLPQSTENYYLRKEAIRFVEEDLMKTEWEPAVQFGEFKKIRFVLPVAFKIPKPKASK